MKLQYLGHSFFKVLVNNFSILIDPFINNTSKDDNFRSLMKCPVTEKTAPRADAMLISQEQFDHFDRKAVEAIAARDNSIVVSHESVLRELSLPPNNLRSIGIGENFSLRGIDFEVIPAHRPQSFYPMGFLIKHNGKQLYFAGDTDLTDHFARIKPDVALLPIGGNITMDVLDAVRATKTMKPKYAIPMHYDTFPIIKADPQDFRQRIEKSILKTVPVILKPGQEFEF